MGEGVDGHAGVGAGQCVFWTGGDDGDHVLSDLFGQDGVFTQHHFYVQVVVFQVFFPVLFLG